MITHHSYPKDWVALRLEHETKLTLVNFRCGMKTFSVFVFLPLNIMGQPVMSQQAQNYIANRYGFKPSDVQFV